MDREYFLRRHDEELARAREATSDIARQAHEALAKAFKEGAERLEQPMVVLQTRSDDRPAA
jgi:hypothetical protein